MPVSTRSNQKRWPPRADEVSTDGSIIVGSGDELTLPQDLYWQYVQPYIPLNYRPILNKNGVVVLNSMRGKELILILHS